MRLLVPLLVPLTLSLAGCGRLSDCVCTEIYDPVCGFDGQSYSNPCHADCAGVSWSRGVCTEEAFGRVLDLGSPALDGCGWMIEISEELLKPIELDPHFQTPGRAVELTFRRQTTFYLCGLGAVPYPEIEIIDIN